MVLMQGVWKYCAIVQWCSHREWEIPTFLHFPKKTKMKIKKYCTVSLWWKSINLNLLSLTYCKSEFCEANDLYCLPNTVYALIFPKIQGLSPWTLIAGWLTHPWAVEYLLQAPVGVTSMEFASPFVTHTTCFCVYSVLSWKFGRNLALVFSVW